VPEPNKIKCSNRKNLTHY